MQDGSTPISALGASGDGESFTSHRVSGPFPSGQSESRQPRSNEYWPRILVANDYFGDEFSTINLKNTRLQDNLDNTIDTAAEFYKEVFNAAGKKAGIQTQWTSEQTRALIRKRLKEPGVAFLLIDKTHKIVGAFFMELRPGIAGWRGIELDVIVAPDCQNKGIGSSIILYGFNTLIERCRHNFGPVVALEAETYFQGYQEQLWGRLGFGHDMSHTTRIDSQELQECDLAISPLTKGDFDDLRTLLLNPKIRSSLQRTPLEEISDTRARERLVTSYIRGIDQYMDAVEGAVPATMYVARNAEKEIASFLDVHATIRRNGRVALTTPFCVVDHKIDETQKTRQVIRALFCQAARDSLEDARKHGVELTPVTEIEFGGVVNPGFFSREGLVVQMDPDFYGINSGQARLRIVQEELLDRVNKRRTRAFQGNYFAQPDFA